MKAPLPCSQTSDGVVLPVLVVPGASRERVCGVQGDRLKVAVTAPPEKGKANKNLAELLAKIFDLRKRQVSVIRGLTHRQKDVLLEGLKIEQVNRTLSELIDEGA